MSSISRLNDAYANLGQFSTEPNRMRNTQSHHFVAVKTTMSPKGHWLLCYLFVFLNELEDDWSDSHSPRHWATIRMLS
jgi:hypothetical protein